MGKTVAATLKDILNREEKLLDAVKKTVSLVAKQQSKNALKEVSRMKAKAIKSYKDLIKATSAPAKKKAAKKKTAKKKAAPKKKAAAKKAAPKKKAVKKAAPKKKAAKKAAPKRAAAKKAAPKKKAAAKKKAAK